MSRLRYATTRALYETFPRKVTKLAELPTDEPPITFLKRLSSEEKFEDAMTFCAYMLPRREAVWWGCGCARAFIRDIVQDRAGCLVAAETWVREPDEARRLYALDLGRRGDNNDELTWLALAAGWAGGQLGAHPKLQVPVPQYLTPRAVRIAVLLSALHIPLPDKTARVSARIEEGIKLAEVGLNGPGGKAQARKEVERWR
jgi:Family of unknown function (DUF6931)